jgi:TRAP-type C4-dicarboxylate transport system permease small subunit
VADEPETSSEREPPPLARRVKQIDDALGQGERVLIALVFATLVGVGFYRTGVDILFKERPLWSIELIKVCVFAIAMLGAAYATHLHRNFSLDLVSRYLGLRGRAYLRIFVHATTVFAGLLLYHGGELVRESLKKGHESYEVVPMWVIGWFVPLAAVFILIHSINHIVVEVAYLADGREAPEPDQAVG